MSFVHKREGYVDHKHETIAEARLCEQGRMSYHTVTERPKEGGMKTIREAKHQDPCVCGTYDMCYEFRVAKASRTGKWRDMFRAYND
jgi:hypothetical protein